MVRMNYGLILTYLINLGIFYQKQKSQYHYYQFIIIYRCFQFLHFKFLKVIGKKNSYLLKKYTNPYSLL